MSLSIREHDIENALIKAVKSRGGICPKFVSPGLAGVPDRIILLPNGRAAFAELKAPGKKPRTLQQHRIAQLHSLGFKTFIIDGLEQIGDVLNEVSAP